MGKLGIFRDTGKPGNSTTYTTVVLFHGFAWHSGIFTKLSPYAAQSDARLVLVNRRDYPGADDYTEEERAVLRQGSKTELLAFLQARAQEVYDLLEKFVADNDIPPAEPAKNQGGIVLVTWSFSTHLATALLANVTKFSSNEVELEKYIRRVIFHDTPYHTLGFRPVDDPYNPLTDSSLPADKVATTFADWVSGYYDHSIVGNELKHLERRQPKAEPKPTLSTLTEAERDGALYPLPGHPEGSDSLLLMGGIKTGVFADLRNEAITLPKVAEDEEGGSAWTEVEVRYVWCANSVWEMPWSVSNMRQWAKDIRANGNQLRKFTLLKLDNSNHFVHWDQPELALASFLTDKTHESL